MHAIRCLILSAALAAAGCAGQQHVASAPSQPVAVSTPIQLLMFLSGTWQTKGEPLVEETWSLPLGESMLGMSRTITKGQITGFEFMRIDRQNGLVTYNAQPNGKRATPFVLSVFDGRQAVFENPTHDFPQRIIYRVEPDGGLYARIENIANNVPPQEFRYVRIAVQQRVASSTP